MEENMNNNNNNTTDAVRYGSAVEAGLLETVALGEYLDNQNADDYETPGEWFKDNYTDATNEEVTSFESAAKNATADSSAELWREWLLNDVLEVKVLGEYSNSWEVTGVEVLLTYGGPSCRLIWNGNFSGWFELLTTWGGDTDRRNVNLPELTDIINEYAEEVTA
jgi:hypothetical protein